MKLSTFVAAATTAAITLFSGTAEAQVTPLSGFTPVRGPIGVTNNVVRRLPLEYLASERPDIYNMFVLALQDMQYNKRESDSVSYYQIAGIHGVPFAPWQETLDRDIQDESRGYCTHNSALFATWHRPYLALFEERLVKHAVYVASKFRGSEASRWQAAARNVRLPYWDWAASNLQSRMPAPLSASTVTVTRPGSNGTPERATIRNPLVEYQFQDDALRQENFRNQFRDSEFTRRQPSSNSLSNSNQNAVNDAMNRGYSSRRSAVFNLFTIPNFNAFSNTALSVSGQPNSWNSVESLHNTVHVNVGGQFGHMTAVPYSAYDPIFWLHHANVDRLIAMYQAIHQNRGLADQPASGTFARRVRSGDRDTISTPLAPFRNANGQYLTSREFMDVSSIFRLGYAYSEVPYEYRNRLSELPAFTTSQVRALYGSSSGSRKRSGEYERKEWICHVTFDAAELPGSAAVQVYFDKNAEKTDAKAAASPVASGTGFIPQPTEAAKFGNATVDANGHFVGACASFQDPSLTGKMKMDITGAVFLSDALLEAGCPSLDDKDVVPFLKKNLKWVVKLGGVQEVPLSSIKSLKVGVSSSPVKYPAEDTKLPEYGAFKTHIDITEKKPCGFTPDDKELVKPKPISAAPPVTTVLPPSSPSPCSTEVNGPVTTIHTTVYTTVCPDACKPVTTAFTSIYPAAATPAYSVY